MPPVRRGRRSRGFTVPYHRFLGPGTDLEDLKYLPALNKIGQRNDTTLITVIPRKTMKESDEQFYRDSEGTGILGAVSKTALRAKSSLGLDSYFRPDIDLVHTNPSDSTSREEIMADQDATTVADSDAGGRQRMDRNKYRWNITTGNRERNKSVRIKATI